ncbi:hypothetical protein, partial [Acidovorax cavernicola]|uniref:hypothetical protein n=1 Tax=Acidovorax cavernicola TaxID=1675792 RepID=UPI00142D3A4A
ITPRSPTATMALRARAADSKWVCIGRRTVSAGLANASLAGAGNAAEAPTFGNRAAMTNPNSDRLDGFARLLECESIVKNTVPGRER